MPAPKKHPSLRARANKASTAATLTTPKNTQAPELPARPVADDADREWSPRTLAWWSDLWASPMSSEYHTSDGHQLVVLAILMDDFFTATSRTMRTAIATELRQQRQPFGMTPYDRRRLEWQIESTEEAKDRGKSRRERQTPAVADPANDPRQVLRAVQ